MANLNPRQFDPHNPPPDDDDLWFDAPYDEVQKARDLQQRSEAFSDTYLHPDDAYAAEKRHSRRVRKYGDDPDAMRSAIRRSTEFQDEKRYRVEEDRRDAAPFIKEWEREQARSSLSQVNTTGVYSGLRTGGFGGEPPGSGPSLPNEPGGEMPNRFTIPFPDQGTGGREQARGRTIDQAKSQTRGRVGRGIVYGLVGASILMPGAMKEEYMPQLSQVNR